MAEEETTHETHEVTSEEVATHPEQAAHHVEPHHEVAGTVAALGERVSSLESIVQGLLPENQDEKPGGKPWTHRGWGKGK